LPPAQPTVESEEGMMSELLQIGSHVTGFEAPDILFMKLVGDVSNDEVKAINQAHLDYGQTVEQLYYLIDLSQLDNLAPHVRKEASEVVKALPLRGTAIYGAPLKAKVLAKLMLTAANMFRGGKNPNPVEFLDNEAEARAWIERRRSQN
jgi:hypothetical protein